MNEVKIEYNTSESPTAPAFSEGTLRINTGDPTNATQFVEKIPLFTILPESKNSVLRLVAPEFDFNAVNDINPTEFSSSMVETCIKANGIGLAAPQCGFNIRMFVIGTENNYVAMFNPRILESSEQMVIMEEGCLSFPNLYVSISRPKTVLIEYQNYKGILQKVELDGLGARCVQHELDHLDGVLYLSRAKPMALARAKTQREKILRRIRKNERMATQHRNGNTSRN